MSETDEKAHRRQVQLLEILQGLSELKVKVLEMLEDTARPHEIPPPPDAFDMGRFWWEAPPTQWELPPVPEETEGAPPPTLAGGKPGA